MSRPYKLYAYTDDPAEKDDPMVPGICSLCGALVPGPNVLHLDDLEMVKPSAVHEDYHRERGEL